MAIRRVFLSWLNDDNIKIEGYVELIEEASNFLRFKRGHEIILIPYSRVLKLKEAVNG